ncbi:hypothetical protein JOS77_10435 [Chromobacterium haemolyticum]|nr:hypothetical protein JOS77_10435 [Chromobacterium haemolyticum]
MPSGDLNASLQAKGQLASPLNVAAKLQFSPSKLSGAPLSGAADLQLQGERLKSLSADLRLAQNRLQANGAYGAAGDKLKLLIDAPNLGLIGPGFSGVVKGQGELAGTPKAPLISANLQADRLKLPGNIAVQSMQFSGNVKADQNSPFQLKLDVAALQAGRRFPRRAIARQRQRHPRAPRPAIGRTFPSGRSPLRAATGGQRRLARRGRTLGRHLEQAGVERSSRPQPTGAGGAGAGRADQGGQRPLGRAGRQHYPGGTQPRGQRSAQHPRLRARLEAGGAGPLAQPAGEAGSELRLRLESESGGQRQGPIRAAPRRRRCAIAGRQGQGRGAGLEDRGRHPDVGRRPRLVRSEFGQPLRPAARQGFRAVERRRHRRQNPAQRHRQRQRALAGDAGQLRRPVFGTGRSDRRQSGADRRTEPADGARDDTRRQIIAGRPPHRHPPGRRQPAGAAGRPQAGVGALAFRRRRRRGGGQRSAGSQRRHPGCAGGGGVAQSLACSTVPTAAWWCPAARNWRWWPANCR